MTDVRWRDNASGSASIVCNFTWGDGHVCPQLIAIASRHATLLRKPRGHHFGKPDDVGVTPLLRNRKPRRSIPDAEQPTDEWGQPMHPSSRWGVPTAVSRREIIGETVSRPARIRCPECNQVRPID